MRLFKRRPFAVGYNIPQLGVDALLHLFIFYTSDFHKVAVNANNACVNFMSLLQLNIRTVARKVLVPSITIFVSRRNSSLALVCSIMQLIYDFNFFKVVHRPAQRSGMYE